MSIRRKTVLRLQDLKDEEQASKVKNILNDQQGVYQTEVTLLVYNQTCSHHSLKCFSFSPQCKKKKKAAFLCLHCYRSEVRDFVSKKRKLSYVYIILLYIITHTSLEMKI